MHAKKKILLRKINGSGDELKQLERILQSLMIYKM